MEIYMILPTICTTEVNEAKRQIISCATLKYDDTNILVCNYN